VTTSETSIQPYLAVESQIQGEEETSSDVWSRVDFAEELRWRWSGRHCGVDGVRGLACLERSLLERSHGRSDGEEWEGKAGGWRVAFGIEDDLGVRDGHSSFVDDCTQSYQHIHVGYRRQTHLEDWTGTEGPSAVGFLVQLSRLIGSLVSLAIWLLGTSLRFGASNPIGSGALDVLGSGTRWYDDFGPELAGALPDEMGGSRSRYRSASA
jgi:hypothetical protein